MLEITCSSPSCVMFLHRILINGLLLLKYVLVVQIYRAYYDYKLVIMITPRQNCNGHKMYVVIIISVL